MPLPALPSGPSDWEAFCDWLPLEELCDGPAMALLALALFVNIVGVPLIPLMPCPSKEEEPSPWYIIGGPPSPVIGIPRFVACAARSLSANLASASRSVRQQCARSSGHVEATYRLAPGQYLSRTG